MNQYLNIMTYKQKNSVAIVKKTFVGGNYKYAVVEFDDENGQVKARNYYGEGGWVSRATFSGIDYVADWVSLKTANKRFKEEIAGFIE